jgi:hypothetical protein
MFLQNATRKSRFWIGFCVTVTHHMSYLSYGTVARYTCATAHVVRHRRTVHMRYLCYGTMLIMYVMYVCTERKLVQLAATAAGECGVCAGCVASTKWRRACRRRCGPRWSDGGAWLTGCCLLSVDAVRSLCHPGTNS